MDGHSIHGDCENVDWMLLVPPAERNCEFFCPPGGLRQAAGSRTAPWMMPHDGWITAAHVLDRIGGPTHLFRASNIPLANAKGEA